MPYRHHIVVHALQLLLCGIEYVWGWVEFIGLEALVRESNLERLFIFLHVTLVKL